MNRLCIICDDPLEDGCCDVAVCVGCWAATVLPPLSTAPVLRKKNQVEDHDRWMADVHPEDAFPNPNRHPDDESPWPNFPF